MRSPRSARFLGHIIAAVWLACAGCATTGEVSDPLVPSKHRTDAGPFAVFSGFPIAADSPAVRSLHSLETDITTTLGVRMPAGQRPIEVYILNDRAAFNHFLKFYYPELPARRAFFIGQGDQRVVYTYLGDRLEEDLRHEAAHALLNAALGDLPLWLDEGLAEYFEGPSERHGLNPEHLAKLSSEAEGAWKPDLARLEGVKSVKGMTPLDYRESWAWVHYFLNEPVVLKPILLAYLRDTRERRDARPLSARLTGRPETIGKDVATHISKVREKPPIVSAPPTAPTTVRLQNPPRESLSSSGARRSVFGRFRAWLGL
jgi:hypothetical protein